MTMDGGGKGWLGEIVGDKNKMDFSIEKKIRKEKRNRKRVKRI